MSRAQYAPGLAHTLSPPENLREQRLTDVDPGVYAALRVNFPRDKWGEVDDRYKKPSYSMVRVRVTATHRDRVCCYSDTDLFGRAKPLGAMRTDGTYYEHGDNIPADEPFLLPAVCCTWSHWLQVVERVGNRWEDEHRQRLQANADLLQARLIDFGMEPRAEFPTITVDAPALQVFLDDWPDRAELLTRISELEQELAEAKRVAA